MKTTIEQAIEQAYGKYWATLGCEVTREGWIDLEYAHKILKEKEIEMEHKSNYVYFSKYEYKVRPASLKGIENNNRWISAKFPVEIDENKSYDLFDAENKEVMYNVSDFFELLALLSHPSMTHIREHINDKPFHI
ncbi:hypothetical protein D3C87_976730 [compost metagenome]